MSLFALLECRTIVQFVDANHPSSSVDTATLAVSQLLSTTSTAVSLLSPYTEALGERSLGLSIKPPLHCFLACSGLGSAGAQG